MNTSLFITNEALQAVIGTRGSKKISIKSYAREPLPEDSILNGVITNDDAIKNAIQSMWSKCHLPTKDIRIVIDSSLIKTKVINVPKTSVGNLLNIVKNEYSDIENYTEMLYDYTVLRARNELAGATILSCATDRSVIASYLELFESQKISVSSIDLSICAAIKCVSYIDILNEQTYAIVRFDGNGVTVALFVNGQFKFTNRTRVISERGSKGFISEINNIINGILQFAKSEKTGAISCFYFCGLRGNEQSVCSAVSDSLDIEACELPNSRNIIVSESRRNNIEKFRLSNYICAVGNL